ncbi:hypothetical protein VitviT2T_028858 [Vitis vinifera]|uniref:C-JID domain-containing protein n=1 Tax=Vitis vinifera TaxID=29760 RepID=A0ABY9DVH4_VITVI|nr:hypothetical protein VitviT2T_028858 [Vitis vinifera]
MIFMIQRSLLQHGYQALVQGSRIPKWFTHRSEGSKVIAELPPHWYNTKLMGLAACVVFNFKGAVDGYLGTFPLACFLDGHYATLSDHNSLWTSSIIESDHTWFAYISRAELEAPYPPWFGELSDYMLASFLFLVPEGAVTSDDEVTSHGEVKKCGVRIVYEEDGKYDGCSFPFSTMWPGDGDGDGGVF